MLARRVVVVVVIMVMVEMVEKMPKETYHVSKEHNTTRPAATGAVAGRRRPSVRETITCIERSLGFGGVAGVLVRFSRKAAA